MAKETTSTPAVSGVRMKATPAPTKSRGARGEKRKAKYKAKRIACIVQSNKARRIVRGARKSTNPQSTLRKVLARNGNPIVVDFAKRYAKEKGIII